MRSNSPTTPPAPAKKAAGGVPRFYQPDNYFADESVGYLMRMTVNTLAQEVERQMEPNGLTNAQWVPLLKVYLGHAGTGAELARVCQLDAGSMTRLLDRLEAKGLLRRERSAEDRRVVKITLTPEGRAAAEEIPVVLSRIQNACLAGFSRDEWLAFKGYLRRFLNNAQALAAGGKSDEP